MTIEIKKPWEGLKEQRVRDMEGNEWAVSRLVEYAKDLPVMEMPMEHLCISKNIKGLRLRDFVAHMKQVLGADLSYPIILDEDGDIFDGVHRVAKALLEGVETIKAVRLENDPSPDTFGKKNKD
jgi:hypothetical protein